MRAKYLCPTPKSKTWPTLPIDQAGKLAAVLAFGFAFCGAPTGYAREIISLKSGFQIEADSHQENNGVLTLQLASGTLEFQTSEVAAIEAIPEPPTIPAIAAPPAVAEQTTPEEILKRASSSQATSLEFMDLVLSVAKIESGMRQDAISNKGAQGLMQLMPETASALGVDARKAEENATGGAAYLRDLLERYHHNPMLALAAYNAGPGAVSKYGGVPPYAETRLYIERVLQEYSRLERQRHSPK
ncbi:MAG TPA: lytic transglycosylase domain-containing protein [Bryobacteraceae bacterium]|nr:lytic transglycosylase domain-containing protein [Bryobacteraceae bacterium]